MRNKAFHGNFALLHLSALLIAMKVLWDALAEQGRWARAKATYATLAILLHAGAVEHHARHYYVD